MKIIGTIGYEGSSLEDFVATLKAAQVEMLIDIRDLPVSRKRGFSKKALSAAIKSAGLEYLHLGDLGNPKPGREAARRGDMGASERIFRARLTQADAQDALRELLDLSARLQSCLLCFERDPAGCHRSIVADAVAGLASMEVRHLWVHRGLGKERAGIGGNASGLGREVQ